MKKYIKLYEEYTMERVISNIDITLLDLHHKLLAVKVEKHIYYVYLYDEYAQGVYKYKFSKKRSNGEYKVYVIDLKFTDGSSDSYMEYIISPNYPNPTYEETDENWINDIEDKHFIVDKNLCRLLTNADGIDLDILALYKTPHIIKHMFEVYSRNDINNKALKEYTKQVRYEDVELDLSSVANDFRGAILADEKLYNDITSLGIDLGFSDDVKNISTIARSGNHKLR